MSAPLDPGVHDGRTRLEVLEIAPRSEKVWPFIGPARDAVDAAVLAQRRPVLLTAVEAPAARDARRPRDAIPFLQRRAECILGYLATERGHRAHRLMAEDDGGRHRQVPRLEMDVGAANAPVGHLYEECPGLGIGCLEALDLEWRSERLQNRSPASHCRRCYREVPGFRRAACCSK